MSLGPKATVVDAAWQPPRFGLLGWFAASLSRHWDLLWQLTITDLRGRYVGSSLGLFWSVIHPLVMITIYTIVFSRVMGARIAGRAGAYGYGVFLCSALLPWSAFLEVVTRCTTIFVDHASLVRKVAFPKVVLYGYVAVSSAVNLGLALSIFVVAAALMGHAPNGTMLLWFPFIVLQLLFGLGIGMVLSVVHVFVRDTAQLVGVLLQVAFWLTPIIYVEDALPDWLRPFETVNPLFAFARSHHDLVLYGTVPGPIRIGALLVLTFTWLALGTALYRRFRADILDEL
jgi:lipopolysaccharide transport system permease protein